MTTHKTISDDEFMEKARALEAIIHGYRVFAQHDYLCVENPKFQEDDGSNPNLVIPVSDLGLIIATALRSAVQEAVERERDAMVPALISAKNALRPLYNAVFNDNGDMTVSGPYHYDEAVAGYFAYRKIESAIRSRGQPWTTA